MSVIAKSDVVLSNSEKESATETKAAVVPSYFSIDITRRILGLLASEISSNKTGLARGCGLNYKCCTKYLELFVLFGWAQISSSERLSAVSLTESGRRIHRNLCSSSTNFAHANL